MKSRIIPLLLFTFLIGASVAGLAQFNPVQIIGDTIGESDIPKMAAEGSDVYLLWRGDAFVNGVARTQVLFRRSVDSGHIWRETLNLSQLHRELDTTTQPKDLTTPTPPKDLDLATSVGNVYAVWSQIPASETGMQTASYKIFGMVSQDGGRTFKPLPTGNSKEGKSIFGDDANAGDSLCPAIAAEGNRVYLVWLDNQIGNGLGPFRIRYSVSMDGGYTFTAPVTLSQVIDDNPVTPIQEGIETFCPDVAVSGSTVVVAWPQLNGEDTKIILATSNNGAFPPHPNDKVYKSISIGPNTSVVSIEGLQLAAEGNIFLATWAALDVDAANPFKVFVAHSFDRGKSFELDDNPVDGRTRYPTIVIRGGIAWLALQQQQDNEEDILLLKSEDGGQKFTIVQNLTDQVSDPIQPTVAVYNGRIHVAWMEDAGGAPSRFHIYYRTNRIDIPADTRQISEDLGISDSPKIAIQGSNVYVVWRSDDDGSGVAGRRIMFRRSTNFGVTFEPFVTLSNEEIDGNPKGYMEVRNPAIAARGNFIIVIWEQRECSTCTFDLVLTWSKDGGRSFWSKTDDNYKKPTYPAGPTQGMPQAEKIDATNLSNDVLCGQSFRTGKNQTKDIGPYNCSNDESNVNDIMPDVAMGDQFAYFVWAYDLVTEGSTSSGSQKSDLREFQILYLRCRLDVFFDGKPTSLTLKSCITDATKDGQFLKLSNPSSVRRVSTTSGQQALDPSIAVNGPVVDVVWVQKTFGSGTSSVRGSSTGDSVYSLTSTMYGDDFENFAFTPQQVSLPGNSSSGVNRNQQTMIAGDAECPTVVTQDGNRYIAWSQTINGNFEVALSVTNLRTGTSFRGRNSGGNAVIITEEGDTSVGQARCPNLTAGDEDVFLAWFDSNSKPGDYEIFALRNPVSTGTNPSPTNISKTFGDSEFPDLALDGNGRLFAVWLDKTSGKPEIFFDDDILMEGGTATSAASAPQTFAQAHSLRLATLGKGDFSIQVLGAGVQAITVELFNLGGQRVLEQSARGAQLSFQPQDQWGRPLANGVYLYLVTVNRSDGSTLRSEIKKLVVLR